MYGTAFLFSLTLRKSFIFCMLNVILKPEEVTVHAYDIDDDGGDGTEVELDGG